LIVVDTTVLVYAVGDNHSLRDSCRSLIDLVAEGRVRATTTVEVVQEFAHVRSRRRPRDDAVRNARSYAVGLSPLISPDSEDLMEGLTLYEASPRIGAFDAVLAAAAKRRGWALVSTDDGFSEISGLVHLNPALPEFLQIVIRSG
jgi:predicted nucleic acid-binding protein